MKFQVGDRVIVNRVFDTHNLKATNIVHSNVGKTFTIIDIEFNEYITLEGDSLNWYSPEWLHLDVDYKPFKLELP